jgi:hypothetical protein
VVHFKGVAAAILAGKRGGPRFFKLVWRTLHIFYESIDKVEKIAKNDRYFLQAIESNPSHNSNETDL